jgi:hypothetical protein
MADNADAEINEPAVAYRTGIVGNTFADSREPYRNRGFNDYGHWDDDDDEPLTPEQEEAIRNDPAFIAWKEGIIQSILKGVEEIEAGRQGIPIEDVWQDLKRRVENGEL